MADKKVKKTETGGKTGPEKSLVIVESPAKAKTINKILGLNFKVKASMGHIRDLPTKEFGIDVDNDFEPQYKILPNRGPLVSDLKKTAKNMDIIYLAPDPDREGEAIAWHLAEILGKDKPIRRVSFNEITQQAVLQAFAHPRQIDMKKVDSQQARRILDRIVGYKISPLLWRKVGKGLSAGRVQSVAVRLVCEREEEINKFVQKEYWSIISHLSRQQDRANIFDAQLDKINGEKFELGHAQITQDHIDEIQQKYHDNFLVKSIQSKDKNQKPNPPFITSQLQQAASTNLRYSVQRTMRIAQQLYEGIELGDKGTMGLITYMRTDSYKVAQEAQEETARFCKERYGERFIPEKPNQYKSKKSAQEAHESIRPTSVYLEPDQIKQYLSEDQYKIYRLIWERFVASQMVPAQMKMHAVEIEAGPYLFKMTGTEVIFPGYLIAERPAEFSDEDENAENVKNTALPSLDVGEKLCLDGIDSKQHFTKPPPRFTEASLVKALEEKEIGRPSTYAPTIQTVLKRDYIRKDKQRLIPTELGMLVTKLLMAHFPDIVDYEFTAKMEADLDNIEEGNRKWQALIGEFYKPFMVELENASQNMETVKRKPEPTDEVCEKCGAMMVIRTGRYGKFLACSAFPKCRMVKPIDTGHQCPKEGCDGKVVQRRSKRGKMFFGCTSYPKCDFTISSLQQLETPTPQTQDADLQALETPPQIQDTEQQNPSPIPDDEE
ncbi:MAG: type I DNA topoisomerase [Chlamydiota bacterium]|nr:type I DNA topoisomerase [Chlamydiota bacterium]